MGGGVASEGGNQRRLPKIWRGSVRGLKESNIWVGLLDSQKRQQPLEFRVDDQEWLYQPLEFLQLTIYSLGSYSPLSKRNKLQTNKERIISLIV